MDKSIRKKIRNFLLENFDNYPPGTANDPNAPWNEPEDEEPKMTPDQEVVDLIYYNPEFALFKKKANLDNTIYYFHFNSDDANEIIKFGTEPEINTDAVYGYVNNYWNEFPKGKGFNHYQSGDYEIVILDDESKKDLLDTYGDEKIKILFNL